MKKAILVLALLFLIIPARPATSDDAPPPAHHSMRTTPEERRNMEEFLSSAPWDQTKKANAYDVLAKIDSHSPLNPDEIVIYRQLHRGAIEIGNQKKAAEKEKQRKLDEIAKIEHNKINTLEAKKKEDPKSLETAPKEISSYFVAPGSWMCPTPGGLIGGHYKDKGSNCIPPVSDKPQPVVVMDVDKGIAFTCIPNSVEDGPLKGMIAESCNYVLASSLIDKDGIHLNPDRLKDFARKQTSNDIRALDVHPVVHEEPGKGEINNQTKNNEAPPAEKGWVTKHDATMCKTYKDINDLYNYISEYNKAEVKNMYSDRCTMYEEGIKVRIISQDGGSFYRVALGEDSSESIGYMGMGEIQVK